MHAESHLSGLLVRVAEGDWSAFPIPAVRPVPRVRVMISLEPPGRSPTGQPTGKVQFSRCLGAAGPNS
jgi:anti-sigma-K factor RskA